MGWVGHLLLLQLGSLGLIPDVCSDREGCGRDRALFPLFLLVCRSTVGCSTRVPHGTCCSLTEQQSVVLTMLHLQQLMSGWLTADAIDCSDRTAGVILGSSVGHLEGT